MKRLFPLLILFASALTSSAADYWRTDGKVLLLNYGEGGLVVVPPVEPPVDPPAGSFVAVLPDLDVYEPTTIPATFAAFDVSGIVTNLTAASDAPQIAEFTRQNDSGDTMALTAENLDEDFAHFLFYSEDTIAAGGVQRIDGRQAAVTLPDGLTADDMYLMWAMNTNGFGAPVAINKTELWWGDDYIAEGDTFRVYGQNLELDGTAHIYIDEIDEWVSTTNCNPYMAKYTLPAGCTSGNSYTVYAHNGHGEKYGWSDPITIEVWGGYGFSEDTATWVDVTDNAYANLDDTGATDCTGNFMTLWNAVKDSQTWPVIYFPTGDYLFNSSGLAFWDGTCDGVMFVGDDSNSVIVCQNATAGKASWKFQRENCYLKDLSFEKLQVGLTDQSAALMLKSDGSVNNITFDGVLFDDRQHTYYSEWSRPMIWCEGNGESPANVKFIDCDIISNRHNDLGGDGWLWENCDFWGNDDCGGYIGGSLSQMALINCTNYTHWDDSNPLLGAGWGKGRWVTSGANKNSRNWYISGNASYNAQPRYYVGMTSNSSDGDAGSTYNDWNAGEQFMKEGGVCKYRGQATATTSNTMTFADISLYYGYSKLSYLEDNFEDHTLGWTVTLTSGTGAGQVRTLREVVDSGGGYIKVYEPWNPIPDSTTHIEITGKAETFVDQCTNAITSTTLHLEDLDETFWGGDYMAPIHWTAYVSGGTGSGQFRVIENLTNGVMTITEPWTTNPDASSDIRIGKYPEGKWYYQGSPTAVSSTTATLPEASEYDGYFDDGLTAVIVAGRGLGQNRQMIGVTDNVLTLASPWLVQPDNTSVISVGQYAINWAIYDNNLHTDLSAYTYENSASAGFELYYGGGAHGVVVEGNTFNGQLNGIYLEVNSTKVFNAPYGNVSPGYFMRIDNNIITNCHNGILDNSVYDWEVRAEQEYADDHIIVGTVIRDNLITGADRKAFSGGSDRVLSRQMMVWDHNTVENSGPLCKAVSNDHGRENDVWIGNSLSGTSNGFQVVSGFTPSFIGNTWAGFTTDYDASYTQFTIPVSVFTTNGTAQTVTVQNAGTATLTWTRSNGAGGTIQPEGSDTFTFTAPTATTFTVSGGGDTKTIYVLEN